MHAPTQLRGALVATDQHRMPVTVVDILVKRNGDCSTSDIAAKQTGAGSTRAVIIAMKELRFQHIPSHC